MWVFKTPSHCVKNFKFVTEAPFPNGQILDSSKLNEFADDNFKIDENGREFSKCLENTL